MILSPGKFVYYKNNQYTVDHVTVQKNELRVKLKELDHEVNSEDITCKPTIFVL